VLFDGGIKKLPRTHQYFGVKAAQDFIRRKQGGIIWHTQGSGKSIVMVLLAKWILENNPHARVAIITDRDELDKQIDGVFQGVGERIVRSESGRELLDQLALPLPRLLCSLIHKFRREEAEGLTSDKAFDEYIRNLQAQPVSTMGELFVFVDECHRTQSGRLHRLMKTMMPNAVFIGFTGTPLLKEDKRTSLEVFGKYIHTYKFCEAVEDGVVLDLVYEARDIDQRLGSTEKIDQWFEARTRGLNKWQKDKLMREWGTMQTVLSSRSRMERIVEDIVFDFGTRPRLSDGQGNAMLVASSIYEACKYYELLQKTRFKGKCAIITSYNPQASDVTKEETGANTETDKQFVYNTYLELLKNVPVKPLMTKTESYEDEAKAKFIKEPANMQLLVVVDKLLTGFDAPPCTFLYIDKVMQDHGLFQAICRTNRLDDASKDFGYIVDYKGLFKKVENAISVYTSELDHSAGGPPPEVLVQERLRKCKERLDSALEMLELLCEKVEPPREELQHIQYFCGNTEIPTDLAERESRRTTLYMGTVNLLRAYGNLADQLPEAGYSEQDIERVRKRLKHFTALRETVRNAAGESLDLKAYEADMRHLIDTYIEADASKVTAQFVNVGLLDLVVKSGIAAAIAAKLSALRGNKDAIAETIENNIRSTITREQMSDPAFYEKMSKLLSEVIAQRKADAIANAEYLKRIEEIIRNLEAGRIDGTRPELDTPGKRAVFNVLLGADDGELEEAVGEPAGTFTDRRQEHLVGLVAQIDATMRTSAPADYKGVQAKEQIVKGELYKVLKSVELVEKVFPIIKAQKEY
jgi:type I restriction enzyme R subunit